MEEELWFSAKLYWGQVSIWSKLENLSNTSTMYRELYLMIFACIWYVPSNIQKGYEECQNWTLFVFLVSFLYFHRYFDYILYSRGVEILPPRSIFTKVVHSCYQNWDFHCRSCSASDYLNSKISVFWIFKLKHPRRKGPPKRLSSLNSWKKRQVSTRIGPGERKQVHKILKDQILILISKRKMRRMLTNCWVTEDPMGT